MLQRPNSNFCKPLKKSRMLSFQPGLRDSNNVRVGRKMATFQLFFQSDRAKDLSAPLYSIRVTHSLLLHTCRWHPQLTSFTRSKHRNSSVYRSGYLIHGS